MNRWSLWRSVLAGAVIGFVEAAGTERERRLLRNPDPVVRFQTRNPRDEVRPAGLWFLFPLENWRRCASRN